MKITVLNRSPEKTISTWEGVSRERVTQWCALEIDGLVTNFQLSSDPGQEYKPGEYEMSPKSFGVTNGRLTLGRVVLNPIKPGKGPQ